MESFAYSNKELAAQTVKGASSLLSLAQKQNKPFYVYNTSTIEKRVQVFSENLKGLDFKIHYAVKANGHEGILKLLKSKGCGADVVSLGEAKLALENGFTAEDIIFSGVAKSKDDLREAIKAGYYQINVESLQELERIGGIAKELSKKARVGLRINPNIKVDTHPYITTGFRENKFGISEDQVREALLIIKKYSPWIELQGVSSHIGSQIRELTPLLDAVQALWRITQNLMKDGSPISTLDMGGGIGIDYTKSDESGELELMKNFCLEAKKILKDFKGRVMMEPGRAIVARSGVLCTRVEYVKFNGFKDFIIVNSGMNHLMRPALYEAFHRIQPLTEYSGRPEKMYDIVGPICESSDVLGRGRQLPEPKEGEWLAIMDAGAYGMSMASSYNHHEFPSEILL